VEASNNNGQVHAVLDSDLSPGSVFVSTGAADRFVINSKVYKVRMS
jgi:hypothetical protein